MRLLRPVGRWLPVAVWAALTVIVLGLAALTSNGVAATFAWEPSQGLRPLLDGLVQYDGHHYLAIASEGYWYEPGERSSIAWFPLYPLAIRAVSGLGVDPVVAAICVTAAAAGAALWLYWVWLGALGSAGARRVGAFLALAVWPFAWYLYGVVYADALFLALVFGSVVLVERDRYVLAGIVGAFATACRPTGIVLVPTLVAIAATRDGVLRPGPTRSEDGPGEPSGRARIGDRLSVWLQLPSAIDRTRLRPRTLAPAISVTGLVAYSAFLWRRFGDPLAFVTNQATFRGRMPLVKGPFFSRLVHVVDTPLLTSTMVLNAAAAVLVLASVGRVARRFGFPYALLVLGTLVVVVVPTDNFIGVGRYMLLAFPALAVVGEHLADRWRRSWAVAALSAALMLTLAVGFSRSVYLS